VKLSKVYFNKSLESPGLPGGMVVDVAHGYEIEATALGVIVQGNKEGALRVWVPLTQCSHGIVAPKAAQ